MSIKLRASSNAHLEVPSIAFAFAFVGTSEGRRACLKVKAVAVNSISIFYSFKFSLFIAC
jgi:hypothetical protein